MASKYLKKAINDQHISRTLREHPFKNITDGSYKRELLPTYVQRTETTNLEVTPTPRAQGRAAARDLNKFRIFTERKSGGTTETKERKSRPKSTISFS